MPSDTAEELQLTVPSPSTPGASRRMKISGDTVLCATAGYDERSRRAVVGLHAHMFEHDIVPAEMAVQLRRENGKPYSDDSVYQLLTGRREGGIDNMVEAIERFLKLEEERAKIVRAPFVRWRLARRIWEVCQGSLIYQKICFVIGETHSGKTTPLIEYQREHNHGETVYVRMPAMGNMGDFLIAMAEALKISPSLTARELRRRVKRSFTDRMLLIVDQAHECFQREESRRTPEVMLYLMEIHDEAKCGIVLAGTQVLRDAFETGLHKKKLKQLDMRHLVIQRLDDAPGEEDLAEFAAAYGLPRARGEALALQKRTIEAHSLGRWCTILQAASRLAAKRKAKLNWDFVLDADAGIRAMQNNGAAKGEK
jgi:DNA transposition AAA+ family ATPase